MKITRALHSITLFTLFFTLFYIVSCAFHFRIASRKHEIWRYRSYA